MPIVHHLARNADGGFDRKKYKMSPMEFVIAHIPDGTPFQIYIDTIGYDNDVTEDFEALQEDADFFIVESVGGGALSGALGFVGKILSPILKILLPTTGGQTASIANNQQGASPNNSLTDRNNKPRPYERSYDICGTVQSIPNDLMTTYKRYDSAGNVIEYGYYDVGRGPMSTPASGITDGDTLLSDITGSSAAVYAPFTSPNSGHAPQLRIGDAITEGLYITVASNEVDGAELRASNDIASNVGGSATARYNAALQQGTILDATGDSDFSEFLSAGDLARLTDIICDTPGTGTEATLSGVYPVVSVSSVDIVLNVSGNSAEWAEMGSTAYLIQAEDNATVGPANPVPATLTDWFTVAVVKTKRVVGNFGASSGMYKDDGNRKSRAAVTVEMQYQAMDETRTPYGPVYTKTGSVSGKSSDQTGLTIIGDLPVETYFRARARRVTPKDTDFNGQVVDDITFDNLYGQTRDTTTNYGNRTTVHTARRQTPRATSIKSPKLALVVTERLYKYLGNGVFDTVLTENTRAVQSLIRLLRDPVCGNLNLTAANMDRLMAVQTEIETYFGSAQAGQFCYTFDSYDATMQDIISIISDAIFCKSYREGNAILLDFDRPRIGPEMVFTHRSKAPGEKWTRNFNTKDRYDSLKFSYIDPTTNIKETINIPADGGVKTETYDSKGIRNYKQAYWAAYRRFQRNNLNRIAVEFTAMEEGIFARPGRAISVVKGSRVSPFDGYIVAVDGLTLVLSQNVEFSTGDDHSLILKKRDGSVQSVAVTRGHNDRTVIMTAAPQEAIYAGNSALKTEFSFGNEERHNAQMVVVSTVEPGSDRTVKITGYNYTDDYYSYDGVAPFGRAFSTGFNNGFS